MSSPCESPLDRILSGLRQLAAEYELSEPPYTLIPGVEGKPDAWLAVCPAHPAAGSTLLIVDRGCDAEPALLCRIGCQPVSIRSILVPDPEREARAVAISKVLLWRQAYSRARRAG